MKPQTTTQRPTKPGYYWYKDSLTNGWDIVKVFVKGDLLYAENDEIFFNYSPSNLGSLDNLEIWSINPINPPK